MLRAIILFAYPNLNPDDTPAHNAEDYRPKTDYQNWTILKTRCMNTSRSKRFLISCFLSDSRYNELTFSWNAPAVIAEELSLEDLTYDILISGNVIF